MRPTLSMPLGSGSELSRYIRVRVICRVWTTRGIWLSAPPIRRTVCPNVLRSMERCRSVHCCRCSCTKGGLSSEPSRSTGSTHSCRAAAVPVSAVIEALDVLAQPELLETVERKADLLSAREPANVQLVLVPEPRSLLMILDTRTCNEYHTLHGSEAETMDRPGSFQRQPHDVHGIHASLPGLGCLPGVPEGEALPNGTPCPSAASARFHKIRGRSAYSCQYCGHHVYPTAGTIFHKTTTSLQLWFFGIYLISSSKCGISAKQFGREIGVSYKTAHRMMKQIRYLLSEDDDEPLWRGRDGRDIHRRQGASLRRARHDAFAGNPSADSRRSRWSSRQSSAADG